MLMLARTALLRVSRQVSATGYYFSVNVADSIIGVGAGLALSTANLGDTVGADANSWGLINDGTNWFIITNAGGTYIDTGVSVGSNKVVNVAWNAGNLYLGASGTYFNSAGASTGSTPTSPTFTGLTGPMYPFGTAARTDNDLTLQPAASPPTGYNAWGGTWNPSDKSANITLTGSNLIANRASTGDGVSVRGTVSYS